MSAPSEIYPVLIADDHQIVIDGIRSMLGAESEFPVAGEANDGQSAYDIIENQPDRFRILLTDISMPLLGGIDLCRMVKQQWPDIKVIFLSMYNSTSAVKEALAAEADGYILKNSGRDELLTALHKVVAQGTYFTQDILPIIYSQYRKEKKQETSLARLTPREKEILSYIVKEYTSEEIANKLFISKKTVDNHRQNLLQKCGCRSTIGLVKFAIRNGMGAQ